MDGQTDGRRDGCRDKISPHSTGLCPMLGPQHKKEEEDEEEKERGMESCFP